MQRQRQSDTRPELELRRELRRRGHRHYRVDYKLPVGRRRADIAFPFWQVAVFVDGCFWHACPAHGTWPKANSEWWRRKLEGNVQRDRDTDERLRRAGWTVIRFWEHESAVDAATRLSEVLRRR